MATNTTHLPVDYEPLNREPNPRDLLSSTLTPISQAYNRNHGPIPQLNASTHTITISDTSNPPILPHPQKTILPFTSLRTTFPATNLTCALQCAGNRRHTMRTKLKQVQGIDWRSGAVMNCTWTGISITTLLSHILGSDITHFPRTQLEGKHLVFSCRSVPAQDDTWYGSSIPLPRALDSQSDILIAYAQNGLPLTPEFGFPVRVVVPGIAGARSVKWLDGITIQDTECANFYQQRDYKILPPEVVDGAGAEGWWGRVDALMDMPINSVVFVLDGAAATEEDGDEEGDGPVRVTCDAEGMVAVHGYALPGGAGGPVIKVEIRIDEGGEWMDAGILRDNDDDDEQKQEGASGGGDNNKWSWVLWGWKGKIDAGRHTIWSRATDRVGNRQDSERSVWNLRGVAYNGYGEVEVDVLPVP